MFERIIVAVDGSETGRRALDAALDMASLLRSSLRVVYVLADPAAWWDAPGYDLSVLRRALLDEGTKLSEEASALFKT
jgi:nucleotide-binding universal stress UspA family protein